MFCAYSWFKKPELYASVRATSIEWAGTGQRQVFLVAATDEGPLSQEMRTLTATELIQLKEKSNSAWEGQDYGGFISGPTISDLKGWCHFQLNPEKTEARLDSLVLDPALPELPPLQSPALHLALLALLEEVPTLESIFLPFGEITDSDRAAMKMFGLAPTGEAGWWLTRQQFMRKTDFLGLSLDLTTPTWYELKMKVAPTRSKLVLRLFLRFGFQDKTRLHVAIKNGPLGEELEDETRPVTLLTYLPKNDRHSQNLADLQEALHNLSRINPLPELELREVGPAEARPFEYQSDYHKTTYRVGRNLVIQIIREGQTNEAAQPGPEDLSIKLVETKKAFGPQPGYIHPTGQLTLEAMEDWLDPSQHAKVLDLGTGTGALAIAAARLGVNYILAIDSNREALQLAQENVALNGLADRIVTEAGSLGIKDSQGVKNSEGMGYTFQEDLLQRPPSLDKDLPFDAILANIFSANLVNLSGALSHSLRSGGLLISSGIPARDVSEVAAAYEAVGLEPVEGRELQGWYAFVHKKI